MNEPVPQSLSIDPSLLPAESDVRRYEESGWYVTREVVPHELLDRCGVAIAEHQAGRRDHQLPAGVRFSDWKPGDGDGVRNNEFCSLQNDGVRELAMFPIIGAIAARLARSPAIRLFDDQAIYKPSAIVDKPTAVGWHTDHSYWSTCTSSNMLTAWIPLSDTSVANGTLYVVEGSHRWPESEHVRGFNDADLDGLEKRLGRSIPESLIVPMVMKKGQLSFHHMRALHASAPNIASKERVALAVHLQDHANAYRSYALPDGKPVVLPHDQLCRRNGDGLPDYSDPRVFPVIWSEAGAIC
jgi:hypothetical protein